MQMFHPIIAKNDDVIQIHHHKIIGEMPQDIVHHPREIFWFIFQAKWHDQPLKMIFYGLEGSIPYINILYQDLVVAIL
jgi:hypothetical protein